MQSSWFVLPVQEYTQSLYFLFKNTLSLCTSCSRIHSVFVLPVQEYTQSLYFLFKNTLSLCTFCSRIHSVCQGVYSIDENNCPLNLLDLGGSEGSNVCRVLDVCPSTHALCASHVDHTLPCTNTRTHTHTHTHTHARAHTQYGTPPPAIAYLHLVWPAI